MAVEKSKVIARYKAIFGSVGLPATRLDVIAAKLASKIADDADDDAIDAELNDLNEVYPFAEIKKNEDRAANERNNPNKKKDVETVEQPKEPSTDMEKMMAAINGLTQTVASLQSQNVGKTRKEQASARLAKFPKEMKEDLLSDIDSMNFADDEAFNAFIERKETTFKTIVEKGKLEMFNGEDTPSGADTTGSKKQVKEIDADLAAKIVS